MLWNAL